MMLLTAYTIECDYAIDDDCEAEFTHFSDCGFLGDELGVRRQLRQRGWRIVIRDDRERFICPLH